jgi:hypothetical protein
MSTREIKSNQDLALAKNGAADAAAGFVDAVDLGTIYTMFLSPILHQFLETLGRYFLFPISLAAHVVKTILVWRQVYLDGGKTRSLVSAGIETVATAAIGVAVIGALTASAVFALATPIIFTATIAGKTLFQAASAIYYAVKAARTDDIGMKKEYRTLAINNAIGTVAGLIATAAVTLVFLLGKIAYAAIGIVGAVAGATLAVVKGYKAYKAAQAAAKPVEQDDKITQESNEQESTKLLGEDQQKGVTKYNGNTATIQQVLDITSPADTHADQRYTSTVEDAASMTTASIEKQEIAINIKEPIITDPSSFAHGF